MRSTLKISAPLELENLFGDLNPLLEEIGSPAGLELAGAVNASWNPNRITNRAELKEFLLAYRSGILDAIELPLICRAYLHASRQEYRELLELDRSLATEPRLAAFASASRRIGRAQVKLLRPLRDQRGLQRFIQALDSGEANAWHTLVYGITLATFSFPLRQGLMHYSEQVLNGFIAAAETNLPLTETESAKLLAEVSATLPHAIETSLAGQPQFSSGPRLT